MNEQKGAGGYMYVPFTMEQWDRLGKLKTNTGHLLSQSLDWLLTLGEQSDSKTPEQQEKIDLLLSACKEALGFVELIEVSPYVSVFLGNKLRTAIAKAEGQG